MPTQTTADMTELIEENLELVNHVVYQVAVRFPRHVDREDLCRAGALGLVEAAQRYDESRGVPFKRFAAQRIRGAVLDHVRSRDWAPRSVRQSGREIDRTEQRLFADLGRRPSSAETAEALGVSTADLATTRARMHQSTVLALDHVVFGADDDKLTLVDTLADPTPTVEPSAELEQRELHTYLRDAVHLLPERHRLVIIGSFIEDRSNKDLSRLLDVTESRISQIRTEALAMLKDGIEAQYEAPRAEPTSIKGRRRAAYVADIAERTPATDRIDVTSIGDLVTV